MFFIRSAEAESHVYASDRLGEIRDCYTNDVLGTILSPLDGTVAFASSDPAVYQKTTLFQLIADPE